MAKMKSSLTNKKIIEHKPKNTRQGNSKNTKYSATARNSAKKKYRGQGKWDQKLVKQWKCCSLPNGIFLRQHSIVT